MNLIAIETATENCSVALLHQGKITDKSIVAPQKHAELVLGYLDELLAEQGLAKSHIDGIVFGQGPGAFTGVRIAMSIVQGLALALDVPVMGISTLKNLAHQIFHKDPMINQKLLVANDARMGEVYWSSFEVNEGQLLRLTEDALASPEAIVTEGYDGFTGSAFKSMVTTHPSDQVWADALPDANTLLIMAAADFSQHATDVKNIQPSYVREKVVFN